MKKQTTAPAENSRIPALKALMGKTNRNVLELNNLIAQKEPGKTLARINEVFIELTGMPFPKRFYSLL